MSTYMRKLFLNPIVVGASDMIKEFFGYPAGIHKIINKYPAIAAGPSDLSPVVSIDSVTKWQDFNSGSSIGDTCTFIVWRKASDGYYNSAHEKIREFESLVIKSTVDDWQCDIQDVSGLSSSKSNLNDFVSLDDMVTTNSQEMINEISKDNLYKNLSHKEIKIIHQHNRDHFAYHEWDARLFLINGDGSHHFAAARYIASRIKENVPLKGRLYTYRLNEAAINRMARQYEMFALPKDHYIQNDFFDAMKSFSATFLKGRLPKPFDSHFLILLPKDEPRSAVIARVFTENKVFDIGLHFKNLLKVQSSMA